MATTLATSPPEYIDLLSPLPPLFMPIPVWQVESIRILGHYGIERQGQCLPHSVSGYKPWTK
jgi:hypothetical protein